MTPYTTPSGVQIGLRYTPSMPRIEGHALHLQAALLAGNKRPANPFKRLCNFVWGLL